MQSDCFLSNKINHHETSGESFNLSEPQFLHHLPYLFKEGSCLDLGFPKLYLAKFLGVGWGKFPCYLCLENLAFSMHHLGESRHTWKGQFFFLSTQHLFILFPATSCGIYLGTHHSSLSVHVDSVGLISTHLFYPALNMTRDIESKSRVPSQMMVVDWEEKEGYDLKSE